MSWLWVAGIIIWVAAIVGIVVHVAKHVRNWLQRYRQEQGQRDLFASVVCTKCEALYGTIGWRNAKVRTHVAMTDLPDGGARVDLYEYWVVTCRNCQHQQLFTVDRQPIGSIEELVNHYE